MAAVTCLSETQLQSFLDGALSPAECIHLYAHVDHCERCSTLLQALQQVALEPAAVSESGLEIVGRYALRRVLGQGGMGTVYEAYDPELERVVAIKLLRPELRGAELQERLRSEALAMAKLSHPHVVSVYDVGVEGAAGTAGDRSRRIFIVMEYVEGASLGRWLERVNPDWEATLALFEQAALGLQAAHAAGLVHRDFKPDNVLVDASGRARVSDFGLAIALQSLHAYDASEGTLRYMAPEQRAGTRVDARSDQYALAAALGEALQRDNCVNAPNGVRRAIARACSPERSMRFESVRAFVAALHGARRRRRRTQRAAYGALAALAMAGGFAGVVAHEREAKRLCGAQAAARSTWTAESMERVRQSFAATASPLWASAFARASNTLNVYVDRLSASESNVCLAERREGTSPLHERRKACLSDRVLQLRAVSHALEQADALLVEHASNLTDLLPSVELCDGEISSLQPVPVLSEVASAHAIRARELAAEARATVARGRYEEGTKTAARAVEEAQASGELRLVAEAELAQGMAHCRLGGQALCESLLERAASGASAVDDGAVAAQAWVEQLHFVGVEAKHYEEGARYDDYARHLLARLPARTDLGAERFTWHRALLLGARPASEAAKASLEELAYIKATLGEQHRLYGAALDGQASVFRAACKSRDALAPQQQACAIFERALGAEHPQVALCFGNLAGLYSDVGEHAQAMRLKQRALVLFEQLPGHPNHVRLAHRNMARSLIESGAYNEAAIELGAASKGASPSESFTLDLLHAELLLKQGKLLESEPSLRALLREHPMGLPEADTKLVLGEVLLGLGQSEAARSVLAEAATALQAARGSTSCKLARPLSLLGLAQLAAGDKAAAKSTLQRALGIGQGAQVDPHWVSAAEDALRRAE